jgi:hypothetical protein
MGKILFSLAFAAALLAVASSEASANFVCQAVGARSVYYLDRGFGDNRRDLEHEILKIVVVRY